MFKTVKTSELTGVALDWAVAKCGGYTGIALQDRINTDWYSPSTEWVQGGPIIERERINLSSLNGWPTCMDWKASMLFEEVGKRYTHKEPCSAYGPTPLIAAMRCYVASKLGDEIEVPKELV